MKSTRAVFTKQAKDLLRNPAVLMQYIIFPAVAFLMTELVAKPNPDIPANMFVCMMASIFAGMALISSAAHAIAEDMEKKSLRFLVMAGVKPHQYLIGTGGFILIAGAVVSVAFAAIGGFEGADLAKFLLVMIAGVAASTLLGSLIGILAKNQQAATAVGTPIAIILGFTPMIATFNESGGCSVHAAAQCHHKRF